MTKCSVCGKEEMLPFVCRYCGQSFCSEHRLPETHGCLMVGLTSIPMERTEDRRGRVTYRRTQQFRTSRTEIMHLAAAIFVFFLIEASGLFSAPLPILAMLGGIVATAFIIHELSHKFVAQYYGMWSEFRLDPFGLILSLMTILSPIKFMAPGAVMIFGFDASREKVGKIALAGPLSNLVQILAFTFLARFNPYFWLAVFFNIDITIFNLIPISILDGKKIFDWSKKAWLAVFVPVFVLWLFLRFL